MNETQHHYESHQWTGGDDDQMLCAICGVTWLDCDDACEDTTTTPGGVMTEETFDNQTVGTLAKALWDTAEGGGRVGWDETNDWWRDTYRRQAAALLPVVRELIAEELEAVAADARLESKHTRTYLAKSALARQAKRIQARADALRDAR